MRSIWTSSYRPRLVHAAFRSSRRYQAQPGPHTTYFQTPPQPPTRPPRRVWRSLLLGTTCLGFGFYAHSKLVANGLEDLITLLEDIDDPGFAFDAIKQALEDKRARTPGPVNEDVADFHLASRAGLGSSSGAISHLAQLPSNAMCEDTHSSATFGTAFGGSNNAPNQIPHTWSAWGIYDGHAGPQTAEVLKTALVMEVIGTLEQAQCLDPAMTPTDNSIADAIKTAFLSLDASICNPVREALESGEIVAGRTELVARASVAQAGSCALFALYDSAGSLLRVANTGDSRAVLGRWDERTSQYVAKPLSIDQTGFNPAEVARLKEQHPDEDGMIDPKTGRVYGMAVSRAFGDARWKWPQDITRKAQSLLWGPRPISMGGTPPYLTAEPEVTETLIKKGKHPDFLIMASDGLWDNMSSEHAVKCVELWMTKFKPTDLSEMAAGSVPPSLSAGVPKTQPRGMPFVSAATLAADDDTYFDEHDGTLRWRVSPKHFTVEDVHCGVHLIRNALGGNRRDLLHSVLTIAPPLSRNVRDDITVQVVFFGDDFPEPPLP